MTPGEVCLIFDTTELSSDIARILIGELSLPIVSAIRLKCGDFEYDEIIYLEDEHE
jgi:hypothetical protein